MNPRQSITTELPVSVRVALARAWVLALACERSLNGQPRDCVSQRLWSIDFITEDLADAGRSALVSLSVDHAAQIVKESADIALVPCRDLLKLVYPEEQP